MIVDSVTCEREKEVCSCIRLSFLPRGRFPLLLLNRVNRTRGGTLIRTWSLSIPLVISLTLWERDYDNMIEDETENRIVAANAGSSQAVAMIEGSEIRVETASSFGPWRAAHRSYRASS